MVKINGFHYSNQELSKFNNFLIQQTNKMKI